MKLGKPFWNIEYYTRRMTTCDSDYAQMHYFQIQLFRFLQNVNIIPSSSRSLCGLLRLLFQTIQTFSHGKEVHFKVVIWNDAATLLDIVLSQVQLQPAPPLSSQHSLALLISLKAVLAFLQNGQNYYIAPTPSTNQPLALLFCTTGRSCIFAERSH